ncbi:amidophosphoribosyltransferase [Clostridiales bacterium COT073_COT-073]|nr:amidophosphoribosyltransferase [Clostridiales bacterium COT073_COT-073]
MFFTEKEYEQDKLKEACGVVGIHSNRNVSDMIVLALLALQHRGQESAGIALLHQGKLQQHKDMGLVREVFSKELLQNLNGEIGIGHVRYATASDNQIVNAQPLAINYRGGSIALAHNGNLVNANQLRRELEECGAIFQTATDSEVLLTLIAQNYKSGYKEAILKALQKIKGAYAFTMLCEGNLIGIRDPHGIRPLVLGKLRHGYMLASETVALDLVGADFIRDIEPGEMVIISDYGVESIRYCEPQRIAHCSFEYVYFARPDSVIDGKSVYQTRKNAGRLLAKADDVEADIVIAVPDSGIAAALGYAEESKIPYDAGLIKNKYMGRTFIEPTQEMREQAVFLKLSVLKEAVKGKRIILIDDSIVRGTTSRRIIKILRDAGAREIHFRISSPPIKYPTYFGIDTPVTSELLGANHSTKEICEMIGADTLKYLSIDDLVEAIGIPKDKLNLDCFNGEYPLEIPEEIKNQAKC